MAKKKLNMLLYLPLYILVSSIFLFIFSANSYAMTTTELDNYFEEFISDFEIDYPTQASEFEALYEQKKQYLYGILAYDSDINRVLIRAQSNNLYFIHFANSTAKCRYYGTGVQILAQPLENETRGYYYIQGALSTVDSIETQKLTINNVWFPNITGTLKIGTNFILWDKNFENETDLPNYIFLNGQPIVQNSITLTSISNHKFGFNDFNQCVVDITGDWDISDFSFYVERLIDNEWSQWTDYNDYYIIYGYENPWYVIWHNINYFPVGTYRYVADYGSMGTDLYYSNEFQITNSVIDNPGTGSIDNGNIDINIDTGETIDNIKDFLGQDPTITEDEFSDSFLSVDVEDPTADFFTWFFNQIKNCFTVNSAQYLRFTILEKNFVVNSDDYILNIPVLSTIIGTGSAIFIFYAIFLDIRREIEKLKEGKFAEIGKEDITASMM